MTSARRDLHRLDQLDLPIESAIAPLREALSRRTSAVLQAEPGAGKTTAVPLRLLDESWLGSQQIVVLEPRRIAARAAAHRMAVLLGEDVGSTVGYRTRDDRRVGPDTRIEVVTDGILTRRLQRDPSLERTGLLLFDEFHERSLTADLGLALTLEAQRELRPDLRVLVASATLDVERIANLLGGDSEAAPIIASPGRTHPVSVEWQPLAPRQTLEAGVAAGVKQMLRASDGDVLAFLPGAAAIRRTASLLRSASATDPEVIVDVRPLYGALDAAEQDAALRPAPAGHRKVVLATDIAETSLTVEGVTAVVDGGLARVPRFDPRTGMTRLQTTAISKASAAQRAGRAGRTRPGTALRLWSTADDATRPRFGEPEITQVDVAGLLLELAAWGEPDPRGFALLDQPPAGAVERGRQVLLDLGAVDPDGRLTSDGRAMAELPLHPRLAAMVVAGRRSGDGWTACLLAALLDERDVLRGRPDERPADLAPRLTLVDRRGRAPADADEPVVARVRRNATALARRADVRRTPVAADVVGRLLLAGFPDRVAQARRSDAGVTTPGQFRLRTGNSAWVAETDTLATERFLVVPELDGDRRTARILLGAAVEEADVLDAFGEQVATDIEVVWNDRDDLVARSSRRLDRLVLASSTSRAEPGPATAQALVARVRTRGLDELRRSARSRALQAREELVRVRRGEPWPDLRDESLLATADEWLVPRLVNATGRGDLARFELGDALDQLLGFDLRRQLDHLVPESVTLADGRRHTIDYESGRPVLAAGVQLLFGQTQSPSVLDGEEPVVLHLLSPAGRPIQITTDLAGFWAGSWKDVRKEMAGRYPKHPWPDDPAHAASTARRKPT